jgi:sugar lactone lactonase YvrE
VDQEIEETTAVPADVAVEGIYFGEGPRWHDGRLWFSDFYGHCVHAVTADGRDEVMLRIDGLPSGLGWLPDGRLLVVSMLDHLVLQQDHDGTVAVHADVSAYSRHRSNDMLVDGLGRAYVGNFGFDYEAPWPADPTTSLSRVDRDGSVSEAASELSFPNGMALTPDGRTLIIAETFGFRLTSFDVGPDGTLSGRRVWADLTGTGIFPDGICLDAEGAVWVAAAVGPRCVRVREGGEIVAEVRTSQNCYACALGDPDRRTLYAMTAPSSNAAEAAAAPKGLVEKARVSVPGVGLP